MAYRNVSVKFNADTSQYTAATARAAAETKAFGEVAQRSGRSVQADAQANIAAAVKRRDALQGLHAEYKNVAASAEKGSATQIAADRLAASTAKRLGEVGTAAKGAEGAAAKLREGLSQVGKAGIAGVSPLASSLESLVAKIGVAGVAGPAAFAVIGLGIAKMAADGVHHFVELTSEIRAFQRIAGTSAEDSSKLVFALKELGIEPTSVGRGFLTLSQDIAKGGEKLDKWGIAVAHNKDGTTDLIGTLFNAADAYNGLSDVTEKNSLAIDLFGKRAAVNLLPFLQRGREGIKGLTDEAVQLGVVFHQQELNQGKELGLQMREAKAAVEGLEIQIGKGLIPVLTQTLGIVTGIVSKLNSVKLPGSDEGGATTLGKAALLATPLGLPLVPGILKGGFEKVFGGGEEGGAEAAARLEEAQARLREQFKLSAEEADNTAAAILKLGGAQQSVTDSEGTLADAQAKLNELQEKGAVDAKAVADAHDRLESASHSLTSAEENLAGAQDRLNDLLTKGPIDLKAVADAEKRAESSSHSLADAQRRLAEAQQHLNEVMAGASAEDLGKGQLSVEQATLSLAQAKQSVADAQDRVTAAYKSGDPNQVADATLALKNAHLGVRDAEYRLADAQRNLNDLQRQGKEGSKDLADAQRGVEDARRAEEQAVRDQAQAQEELRKAQLGDPEFADKVAAAERGVRDARYGVDSATRAVQAARDSLAKAEAGDPEFADKLKKAHNGVESALRAVADARIQLAIIEDTIAQGSAPSNREQIALTIRKWEELRDTFAPGSELYNNAQHMVDLFNEQYKLHIETADAQRSIAELDAAFEALVRKQGGLVVHGDPGAGVLVEVPKGATGGFIMRRSIIEAGEAGPELLLPLNDTSRSEELLGEATMRGYVVADPFNKATQMSMAEGGAWHSYGRNEPHATHESATMNLNVSVGDSPSETAQKVMHALHWKLAQPSFPTMSKG